MSDRDELIRDAFLEPSSEGIADLLLAAGWRKKPSWDALYGIVVSVAANGGSVANIADAILALMDGGSDDR